MDLLRNNFPFSTQAKVIQLGEEDFCSLGPGSSALSQGRALLRTIEALGTIEPSGPFERALARLLIATYKRRLRATLAVAPAWVSEEILSASECMGDRRAGRGMRST
jgi:hypothetical protein